MAGRYTWGCLSYNGGGAICDAPLPADFALLNFQVDKQDSVNGGGKPPDTVPANEPRKAKTLNVPWMDYLHTPYAYPWNFNERLFVPLDKTVDKNTLMNVQPGNIHWLRIADDKVTATSFGSFDEKL
jgi:hypothetical protein